MYPGLTLTSRWLARREIVLPSTPSAGRRGATNLWAESTVGGEEEGVAAGGGSAVLDTGDSEHPRDSGGEASSELEPITGTSEAEAG